MTIPTGTQDHRVGEMQREATSDPLCHHAHHPLVVLVPHEVEHGDAFLHPQSGVPSHGLDEAVAVAEKIREAASVSIGLEGARVTTTLSIGVTLMRSSEDVDSLIARADEAMYEAKSQGRNQVVAIDAGD